jgi:intein/homing endonuclease
MLDLSEVKFSRGDILRNVKLPTKITPSLSELIGIHIGDGSITDAFKDNVHTVIEYCGDSLDDLEYYNIYVSSLIEKLFGIQPLFSDHDTWFKLVINSKAIFKFYTSVIGLPIGKKAQTVTVPTLILNDSNLIITRFLRGLIDTDGSLTFKKKHKNRHYYPVLKLTLASKELIKEVNNLLNNLGFVTYSYFDVKRFDSRTNKTTTIHEIYLYGNKNLERWIKIIGFKNPKHFTKYLIWKKYGFYPPKISHEQRKKIIQGYLNPEIFYN